MKTEILTAIFLIGTITAVIFMITDPMSWNTLPVRAMEVTFRTLVKYWRERKTNKAVADNLVKQISL